MFFVVLFYCFMRGIPENNNVRKYFLTGKYSFEGVMRYFRTVFFAVFFCSIIFVCGCGGDSRSDIEDDQKNLLAIGKALKLFQSEQYFARIPASLEELYNAGTISYNYEVSYDFRDIDPEEINLNSEEEKKKYRKKKITSVAHQVSLLKDWRFFVCPTRLDEVEKERKKAEAALEKGENVKIPFVCDYEFLPWYTEFMPGNTIIVWDKPGNFKTGGNVLFFDGTIKFLKMKPPEYKRFTEGLFKMNDRDYVRSKCADCSVKGFSE